MIKKKKLVRNLVILSFFLVFFLNLFQLSFTPKGAFMKAERFANYGPSQIIKTETYKGRKIYLCKYDKWYSIGIEKRVLGLFWSSVNGGCGFENKHQLHINYSWNGERQNNNFYKVLYGEVYDKQIKSVAIFVEKNGQTKEIRQKKLYGDMFMFILEGKYGKVKLIKGYDSEDKQICKENIIDYES